MLDVGADFQTIRQCLTGINPNQASEMHDHRHEDGDRPFLETARPPPRLPLDVAARR